MTPMMNGASKVNRSKSPQRGAAETARAARYSTVSKTLTTARLSTIAATRGLELPEAFAQATIACAANGKGTPNDRRRYERRARLVASYLDAAEQLGGASTLEGQEHHVRAIREADAGSDLASVLALSILTNAGADELAVAAAVVVLEGASK